jgi:membrane associated rhomboid family serine protease
MQGFLTLGESSVPRVVRYLLGATLAAFVVQWAADLAWDGAFTRLFGLGYLALRRGAVWQLATYLFVHGGLWHLLMNMLWLLVFGPDTERTLGSGRFLRLYAVCGLIAGLGWIAITALPRGVPARCVGASGAVFGILGAYAALFPDRPVTLLLFFVFPVTLRARTLALLAGAVAFVSLLGNPGGIAHAAHLAGGVAGAAYGLRARRRALHLGFAGGQPAAARRHRVAWWRWPRRPAEPDIPPTVEEVDRILDKVGERGLRSLTREERRTLESASRVWRTR